MLAPLGGIGVVVPVPSTGRDFPGLARDRGALGDGVAPNPSPFTTLARLPARGADELRALSSRPVPAGAQPFAIEENLSCVREWDARNCRTWRQWT